MGTFPILQHLTIILIIVQFGHARDSDFIPPEHIHLSLSEDPTVMNVVWTTFPHPEDSLTKPAYVEYGETKKSYPFFATAVTRRVSEGENTEERTTVIHAAKMVGLKPSTRYFYRVGSPENNWSKQFQFITPPRVQSGDGAHIRFAAFGDMGIFEPALQTVDLLESRTHPAEDPYNFLLHVGDLAYAFKNWTKWDIWFTRTQRLATTTPYMISPGNRDETEVVKERFVMPSVNNAVSSYFSTSNSADSKSLYLSYDKDKPYLYYDFNYGFLHVISISIKDNYSRDSEQYEWLETTLQSLYKRVNDYNDPLQWIIVIGHTPLYSSSDGHTGGNKELKDSIEHLLVKYGVHLALWGDDHNYERTYPVYDDQPDTSFQLSQDEQGSVSVFTNPSKPIHLLVGTAGIGLDGWSDPKNPPAWSAYREINHGFVEFDVTENYIKAKFLRSKDHTIGDQFWILKQNTSGRRQAILFVGVAVFFGIVLFLVKERNINLPLPLSRKHT